MMWASINEGSEKRKRKKAGPIVWGEKRRQGRRRRSEILSFPN